MSGHIRWSKVDIWLQGYRAIWLSTVRENGRPHCVPVWYWWDAQTHNVYIALQTNTLKIKNIDHESFVVLSAGNGDDTIILEGHAHLVDDATEIALVNEHWQHKYVDPYSGASATVMDDTLLYRVEVERIMVWEYGIVSTRTDWHFDRA